MNKVSKLADRVQGATAEVLQSLSCPLCDGGIDVQFAPKGRRGKGAGALSVTCAKCMWRVVSDGIPAEPPWVQVLGRKFRTADMTMNTPAPPQPKKTKPTLTG